MTEYPATRIVHCPSGPVAACEEHAKSITVLMNYMGVHVAHTIAQDDDQCANCINEAKAK